MPVRPTSSRPALFAAAATVMLVAGSLLFAPASSFAAPAAATVAASGTASISGSVVIGASKKPLSGVSVVVYKKGDTGSGFASTKTDAKGLFSVRGLPAATYTFFVDASGQSGGLLSEWWSNKSKRVEANQIVLAAGAAAAGKNVELEKGASISGVVKSPANAKLKNIEVMAFDAAGVFRGTVDRTDADGAYTLSGLRAGSYAVRFVDNYGGLNTYRTEWWNDQKTQESANRIVVAVGQAATSKNVVLAKSGGSISGTVTGTPALGAVSGTVFVYKATSAPNGIAEETAAIQPDGTYSLKNVSTGTYKLQVRPAGVLYAKRWWGGKDLFETAGVISVKADQSVKRIDVTLAAAARISGTVRDAAGKGAAKVHVSAFFSDRTDDYERDMIARVDTAADGTYVLNGLAAGSYKVVYESSAPLWSDAPGDYLMPEYWDNKPTMGSSNTLVVAAGQALKSRNAVLTARGDLLTQSGTGKPTITGTARVGSTLTVVTGTWTTTQSAFSYQWLRNGELIHGQRSGTYTPAPGDAGATISVVVSALRSGYLPLDRTSAGTTVGG